MFWDQKTSVFCTHQKILAVRGVNLYGQPDCKISVFTTPLSINSQMTILFLLDDNDSGDNDDDYATVLIVVDP